MKRIAAASALALGLVLGGTVVTTTPASADTPRCYTKKEHRKVHKGTTNKRVHRIFDTRGWLVSGGAGGFVRGYRGCLPRGHVAYITYKVPVHGRPFIHSKLEVNDD